MDENMQLQVRKFLKRLGINSQEQLHKFIKDNPDMKNIPIKVNFQIDGKDLFSFEDNIKF
jgi:hypothetical protein